MATGTYILPICDGCKLPWLPVGWTQDSDPRSLPEGAKPLRCGKCKSLGWDREYAKRAREQIVDPYAKTRADISRALATAEAQMIEMPSATTRRCRHRLTNCSICHPEEAA